MGLLIKLQNGDTALKSLKFGNDRPGGGDSGQPYIQDPLLDNPLPESKDFLLRGGLNAPLNAAEDVARLTKYMFDLKSPSGLLFIAKQNLLSRTAVRTEQAGGIVNEGIYTPLSTLAQAGVGFLGIHLNKQGIDPTGILPGLSIRTYSDYIKTQLRRDERRNNLENSNNRLIELWDNRIEKKRDKDNLYSYTGGPGSILGVGRTQIRFATDMSDSPLRTGINNSLAQGNKLDKKVFYKGGIVRENSDVILGTNENGKEYTTSGLGASIDQGLDDSQIGINDTGTFTSYYNYSLPYSTLSKDSERVLKPLSGSGGYQIGLVRPKTQVNYNKLLGASNRYGLNESELGISFKTGEFNNFASIFNSEIEYSTFLRDNKGLTLSGSGGYQIGKPERLKTQGKNTTYTSQIQQILTNYKREEISPIAFDDGDFSGNANIWAATSDGKFIPKYSSKESLSINPDAAANGTLTNAQINKKLKDSTKSGYLANLNKNLSFTDMDPETGFTKVAGHNPPREGGRGIAGDFRQAKRKKRGFIDDQTYDYVSNYTNYGSKGKQKTRDRIYYNSSFKRTSNSINSVGDDIDLIPFRIKIIDPRSTSNQTTLQFRAYIDNFSDTYSSDWKAQTYMGRGEKFYKYNSFDRSISLGFTIVADNYTNLWQMYDQLNTLAASLAPTYTSQGYMAGNLHGLTVGNYVYDQVGIMDGLSYEIVDETPWEIGRQRLPLYIKVTGIKFIPIHDFRPESQFNKKHYYINQGPSGNGGAFMNDEYALNQFKRIKPLQGQPEDENTITSENPSNDPFTLDASTNAIDLPEITVTAKRSNPNNIQFNPTNPTPFDPSSSEPGQDLSPVQLQQSLPISEEVQGNGQIQPTRSRPRF